MRRGWPCLVLLFSVGCEVASPAELEVVSATEGDVVPRSETIQGRDGAPSGLAFGRTVWTFGDTVLEVPDERGERWHTNSFAHADPARWREGFEEPLDGAGAPRYFIERTPEEIAWDDAHAAEDCPEAPCLSRWAIWPSQPLYDEATGEAWVLYGLFNDHQPSGIGVARWRGLDRPVERLRVGDGWLLFPRPEPEYAVAPTVHDGHLYAFACPPGDFLARPCSLGRVPLDQVPDRDAWSFWDGAAWGPEIDRAATLFEGAPIMSVGWSEALERWLLVYTPVFDHEVYARTAPALEGPWSERALLFRASGEAPYDAQHHPELSEDAGRRLVVTYSRPTDRGWFGAEHVAWDVEIAPAAR